MGFFDHLQCVKKNIDLKQKIQTLMVQSLDKAFIRLSLYPEPESNRHGFPQVFETSASTNSAIWAFAV